MEFVDNINRKEKEENRRAARVENGENDRIGRDKDIEDKVISKDRQRNREASNKDSEEQEGYIVKEEVKEVDEDKKQTTNNVTNNALFVGSTSELSKMLKQGILNNKEDS